MLVQSLEAYPTVVSSLLLRLPDIVLPPSTAQHPTSNESGGGCTDLAVCLRGGCSTLGPCWGLVLVRVRLQELWLSLHVFAVSVQIAGIVPPPAVFVVLPANGALLLAGVVPLALFPAVFSLVLFALPSV